MHEFLISDQFNHYQRRLIKEMNNYILAMLDAGKFSEAAGCIKLARKLIQLPLQISKSDEIKMKTVENIQRFRSGFITEALNKN